MRFLGGFFELELPAKGEPYHPTAQALASGRACFAALLDERPPRRVHVPFYVCDALLSPLRERGIPLAFYALDDGLEPSGLPPLAEDDLAVHVDYFGLKSRSVLGHWARDPEHVILDLVQSFYLRPPAGARGFNSARKWFGVPDGAFLFGAAPGRWPRPENVRVDHLLNRLLGHQELAFRQFRESEAAVTTTPGGMSLFSERLLGAVVHGDIAARRAASFDHFARILGPLNQLPLVRDADAVPFCYPFLPRRRLAHADFHREGVFLPQLWPEVLQREGPQFEFERRLARDLLPLPVDHRLTPSDCDRVIEIVSRLLGEPL